LGLHSYEWYRNSTAAINQQSKEAENILLNDQILAQNYTPSEQDLDQLMELGKQIAAKIKQMPA